MKCSGCNSGLGFLSRHYQCAVCHRVCCGHCIYYCLPEGQHGVENIKGFCWEDFQRSSSIDFAFKYDEEGPENAPIILLVHGGGGCRKLWIPQIQVLSKKYRCVSIDLPGHGSKLKDSLTIDSTIETVVTVVKTVTKSNPQKVLYIGNSLGGYLGFEVVGRHPELFCGALICGAGQNTGEGASVAAKLGLAMMDILLLFPKTVPIKAVVNEAHKNGHIPPEIMEETFLRPGVFFESGKQQVGVLRAVKPQHISTFQGPVLFINGERDHHDSQDLWKSYCKGDAKLVNIKGADHFFSHDNRFSAEFLKHIEEFADKCFATNTISSTESTKTEQ